jgi:uncharacterized membrane protein (DUF485 family)
MPTGIDADIACMHCGYNLRMLERGGQCPECGNQIAPSVELYELDRNRIRIGRCSRRRMLDWIESIICLLLSCAIIVVALWNGFAPYHSPQRKIALGAVCTAWVLSGFGVWKSAAFDLIADDARRSHLLLLRICICVYTALPAIIFARDWIPIDGYDAVFMLACFAAGLITLVMFYGRLAYLAALCDCPRLQAVFVVFQWLSPLAGIAFVLLGSNGRQNSLEVTITMPSLGYQFGLIFGFVPDALKSSPWDMTEILVGGLLLLAALVELASRLFLLRHLIRARRSVVNS